MTLRLTEGFDHISSSALTAAKGWTISQSRFTGYSVPASSGMTTGRIGAQALYLGAGTNGTPPSQNQYTFAFKNLPSSYADLIVGCAIRVSSTDALNRYVFSISNSGSGVICMLLLDRSSGFLSIQDSAGSTVATGTTVVSDGTWFYVEIKLHIAGASGTVEVHLNGAAEIAVTTHNFGSTNADRIVLYSQNPYGAISDCTTSFDDVFMCDTAGSTNNTFLGDSAVETLYPSAAGAHTQWTPDSGSNYARVNEHTSGTYPDGDISYVSDRVVNDRDSYAMSDLALLAGTIFGVQTFMYARKDNAGTRQIAPVLRPVATDRDGATVTLGTSYTFYTEIRETNPDTSAAWTTSDINATEIGVKMVA